MGLCGSFRCGCGITSTPAASGAIDSELPSILVAGSGEPGDPYDLTLNGAWVAALVAELNALAAALSEPSKITGIDGVTEYAVRADVISSTLTTDANGFVTITAASVGLTSITGFVFTNNYNATAGSPTCAGVRITGGNAVARFMKMTDGTAWASSSMGTGHSFIAFGAV